MKKKRKQEKEDEKKRREEERRRQELEKEQAKEEKVRGKDSIALLIPTKPIHTCVYILPVINTEPSVAGSRGGKSLCYPPSN